MKLGTEGANIYNTEVMGFLFSREWSSVQDFGLLTELRRETASNRQGLSLQLVLSPAVYSVSSMTLVGELQVACRILYE